MPADVGDENAPFAFGQLEEIVVIAAGTLRWVVMGCQIHRRYLGQHGGKQRALDFSHQREFPIQRAGRLAATVRSIPGCWSPGRINCSARPDPPIRCRRTRQDLCAARGPCSKQRLDRTWEWRPTTDWLQGSLWPDHPRYFYIVDDPWLIRVDQFREQSAAQKRQTLLLFPRIDVFRPGGAARNTEFRSPQAASTQRNPTVHRPHDLNPFPIRPPSPADRCAGSYLRIMSTI